MGRFGCTRFPTGEAHIRTTAGIVEFRDGLATVEDPDLAAALREVPAVFGIVDLDPPRAVTERPAQSAQKADWVQWAVHNGLPRDQAEALPKADLVKRYGGQQQPDPSPPPASTPGGNREGNNDTEGVTPDGA